MATTFGTEPDYKPQWDRAAQVNGVLKQVWAKTKTQCAALPADSVKAVDAAIVALDAAIAAKDQAKGAAAANAVGVAIPPLFDWFHPDAPIEIVRMDAVFRQVGIDAKADKWDAAKADIASLQTDWGNSKAAVAKRVPTCHRVGGTATVGGDVEDSLAQMTKALTSKDLKIMLTEYEKGALEVDTLELLFDCPPDGPAPSSGVGSACTAGKACADGMVCNMDSGVGRCSPDGKINKIGTACQTTTDCGTDSRAACLTEAGDGYPGGYCGMEPCNDIEVCPTGATCVAIGGETPGCLQICTTDKDCRSPYVCQLFITQPPAGFGPSAHGCGFACKRDSDCQPTACGADCKGTLNCDIASGKCKP